MGSEWYVSGWGCGRAVVWVMVAFGMGKEKGWCSGYMGGGGGCRRHTESPLFWFGGVNGGLRQTTLNANLEVASHPLQAACKALVNSDCQLCFGWTPLYSTSWMIQPCRSWQWTRRSALHPHRHPRLMQSPFTLRLFRAARNDAFNRIMNLGAIGAGGSSFLSRKRNTSNKSDHFDGRS